MNRRHKLAVFIGLFIGFAGFFYDSGLIGGMWASIVIAVLLLVFAPLLTEQSDER